MGALKAARAFTSRPKIAKAEGAYHGEWLFTDPFHLNDRGSEIIADLITEMILKSPRPEDKK
jgi:glutamate-1-semialdehyde aminotransferase